jgi:hypothetical protein
MAWGTTNGSHFLALNPPIISALTGAPILSGFDFRASTTIRDDFHRANTVAGQLGSGNNMPPWRITGGGQALAQLSSNQYICPNGGTVYAFQHFQAQPIRMRAVVGWYNNGGFTADSVVALISSKDSGLFQNAIHIIFNQHNFSIQKRIANVSTNLQTTTLGTPAATDGTQYPISWSLSGTTVTCVGPDGTTASFTDPDFATLGGPWCTWELANGSTIADARFNMAAADFVPPIVNPKFYREVILADSPLAYWTME